MTSSTAGITQCEYQPRLLITGATGFLGGAVAAQLIAAGRGTTLRFLVRASTPEHGLERLVDNLRIHGVPQSDIDALQNCQVICGDLLDTSWLACATPELMLVDRVINCAAMASFSKNPAIWPVNVEGTFRFAEVMSHSKRLQRFVHVGTAMSCGPQRTSPVSESWEFPAPEDHLVDYTESKAEIERRLRNYLPCLPLVVARPSIVVGHSKLGCVPSASIFWVFRMAFALESFTCAMDEHIDVIPVDYCAEALVVLALKPELAHDLYHISAGVQGACTYAQIDHAYALASDCEAVGERYQRVDSLGLKVLAERFRDKVGAVNPRLILRALRLYSGFADLNYLFDNRRLLKEGIVPPPRFTDYLNVCVESSRDVSIASQMEWDFK